MCSRVYTAQAGVGDNPVQTPEDPDSSRHDGPHRWRVVDVQHDGSSEPRWTCITLGWRCTLVSCGSLVVEGTYHCAVHTAEAVCVCGELENNHAYTVVGLEGLPTLGLSDGVNWHAYLEEPNPDPEGELAYMRLSRLPSALNLCRCGHPKIVHWSTSPPYPTCGCRDCNDCIVYEEASMELEHDLSVNGRDCNAEGCEAQVRIAGGLLCLEHWLVQMPTPRHPPEERQHTTGRSGTVTGRRVSNTPNLRELDRTPGAEASKCIRVVLRQDHLKATIPTPIVAPPLPPGLVRHVFRHWADLLRGVGSS